MSSSPKHLGPSGPDDPVRTPENDLVPPLPDHDVDARVYELRGTVSKLEQSVLHLETQLTEVRGDLREVKGGVRVQQKTIWIATGVCLTIAALMAFFGKQVWDEYAQVHELLKRQPPPVTGKPG